MMHSAHRTQYLFGFTSHYNLEKYVSTMSYVIVPHTVNNNTQLLLYFAHFSYIIYTKPYCKLCICSRTSLYVFLCFGFLEIDVFNTPKYFASLGKMKFSEVHATATYPIPSTRMKVLKSHVICVSCMKFASHSEGSKSMYDENRAATTIVTTNGTVGLLACPNEVVEILTVVCQRLTEGRSNAEHDAGQNVLVTRYEEQRGVL